MVAALVPFGVPVLTNGNVRWAPNQSLRLRASVSVVDAPCQLLCPRRGARDVVSNLKLTRAAGIMVAEEILRDPAVFARARALRDPLPLQPTDCDSEDEAAVHLPLYQSLGDAAELVPGVSELVLAYVELVEV